MLKLREMLIRWLVWTLLQIVAFRTAMTAIGMPYKERPAQYMSMGFFGAVKASIEAQESKALIDNSAQARSERLQALVAPLPVGSTSGLSVGPVSNPPLADNASDALPGDMAQSTRNAQIARFGSLAGSLNYEVVERRITDESGREVAGRTGGDRIAINKSVGRGEAGVLARYHELGHASDRRAWPNQNNLPGTLAERFSAPQYNQYGSMLSNQLSAVRNVVYGGAAAQNGNELGEQTADAIGMYLKNPIQFQNLAPELAAVVQSHLERFQPQLMRAAGIASVRVHMTVWPLLAALVALAFPIPRRGRRVIPRSKCPSLALGLI